MLNTIQTVVYEIKIDRIYFADSSAFKTGDRLVLEASLNFLDSDYPLIALQENHQYFLSISQDQNELVAPAELAQYEAIIGDTTAESAYSMQFINYPQIEITQDGYYLFSHSWVDLINENTVPLILEVDADSTDVIHMMLRTDQYFESDFQALIDKFLK